MVITRFDYPMRKLLHNRRVCANLSSMQPTQLFLTTPTTTTTAYGGVWRVCVSE